MDSENSDPQIRVAEIHELLGALQAELKSLSPPSEFQTECQLCSVSKQNEAGNGSKRKVRCASESASVLAVPKRQDALTWDDFFMSMTFLAAMRSKDPSTQVGACIVSPDKRIVGIGYNGFPRGCSDDELPWARQADSELETKYPYVCHAEMNAILNKNSADVKGCAIYVGLFPCNECAKMIIQSGISEVVYLSDKYASTNSMIASRRLLNMSKITLRQHIPVQPKVELDFASMASNAPSSSSLSKESL